ncbi:hypothetical protein GYMLUDRAFT_239936 [Collybiopsis luxurians FD-317 M1]|nr:hypothetical protein GYMLUDRAFT_239936 [Collybiopsis luxurians FD-317 M1]
MQPDKELDTDSEAGVDVRGPPPQKTASFFLLTTIALQNYRVLSAVSRLQSQKIKMTTSIIDCPLEVLVKIFKFYVRNSTPVYHFSAEIIQNQQNDLLLPAPVLLSHKFQSGKLIPVLRLFAPGWDVAGPSHLMIKAFQGRLPKSFSKTYLDFLIPFCRRWRPKRPFYPFAELTLENTCSFSTPEKAGSTLHVHGHLSANQAPRSRKRPKALLLYLHGDEFRCERNGECCQRALPDVPDGSFIQTGSFQMVKLLHLVYLQIQFIGRYGCPQFFDNLFVFNLVDLEVEHLPFNWDWSSDLVDVAPRLLRFIERSKLHLLVLSLIAGKLSLPSLSLAQRLFPSYSNPMLYTDCTPARGTPPTPETDRAGISAKSILHSESKEPPNSPRIPGNLRKYDRMARSRWLSKDYDSHSSEVSPQSSDSHNTDTSSEDSYFSDSSGGPEFFWNKEVVQRLTSLVVYPTNYSLIVTVLDYEPYESEGFHSKWDNCPL